MLAEPAGAGLPKLGVRTGRIRILGLVLTAVMSAGPAIGQTTNEGASAATAGTPPVLRVLLEGDPACASRIVQNVAFVGAADARDEADVHIRATAIEAAEDGPAVELSVTGLDRFAGRSQLLVVPVGATGEGGSCPAQLLHSLELVLAGFAAATPMADHLRVVFTPDGVKATEVERESEPRPVAAASPAAPRTSRASQPNRWAAAIDLGFTSSSGNTDLTSLNTGFRLRHLQTSRFRLEWSSNLRYGESGGEVVARHLQTSLNFDLGPEARFAPFISSSAERDRFRRLDLRSKTGMGVRYGFHKGAKGQASLRLAALYSHERFDPLADRAARSDGTWSLILDGNQRLGESVRVTSTSTFDPVMGDFGDYNLEVRSALSTRMTSNLAVTLGHNYTYDSTPVEGVRPADQRFQAGLTVEF